MICALGIRREHMDPYSRYVHIQHRYVNNSRGLNWNPGGHIICLKVLGKLWHLEVHHGVSRLAGFPSTPEWDFEP